MGYTKLLKFQVLLMQIASTKRHEALHSVEAPGLYTLFTIHSCLDFVHMLGGDDCGGDAMMFLADTPFASAFRLSHSI